MSDSSFLDNFFTAAGKLHNALFISFRMSDSSFLENFSCPGGSVPETWSGLI
jgi:hypothetical protein